LMEHSRWRKCQYRRFGTAPEYYWKYYWKYSSSSSYGNQGGLILKPFLDWSGHGGPGSFPATMPIKGH
jgi:hypothetical protein